MAVLITDPLLEEQLIAERQLTGADRFDEVWEGVYMMAPLADDEHQDIQLGIASVIRFVATPMGALVRAGVNVTDRQDDWKQNYRCPDVVAFLPGTAAENRGSHWFGGPDFAVEVLSRYDRSREKLPFYAKVGTRELLFVDRYPWSLELYVLVNGQFVLKGPSTPEDPKMLKSSLLPLSFRMVAGPLRPQIEIVHDDGKQCWLA